VRGGSEFTHGALYHILSSRLYVGEIVHRGRIYPGAHAAIVSMEIFEQVQRKLEAGAAPAPGIESKGRAPPLLGKLFDDRGGPMTSAHANKGSRRYFYYVSTAVTTRKAAGSLPRISAPRLEATIAKLVSPLLDKHWLAQAPGGAFDAVIRVELGAKSMVVELDAERVAASAESAEAVETAARFEFVHDLARPTTRRQIVSTHQPAAPRIDRNLVRAIIQARRWRDLLASGDATSIEALAKRESACPIYMGQLMPLACLAPDLVEAILDGRQPARLSLVALIKAGLPLRWAEQRALFARFH
jgi:hypothetical protein